MRTGILRKILANGIQLHMNSEQKKFQVIGCIHKPQRSFRIFKKQMNIIHHINRMKDKVITSMI